MNKLVIYLSMVIISMIGVNGYAQDEPPKGQVAFDYSLLRFTPSSTFASGHNLNGGGASFVYYFSKYFGIKSDFQGYGSTTFNFTIPANCLGCSVTPPIANPPTAQPKVNPLDNVVLRPGTFQVQGNMFTYLFGPVIRLPRGRLEPFGQFLFGGAHTNLYTNLSRLPVVTPFIVDPSVSAQDFTNAISPGGFAMTIGGGLDIRINRVFAIRVAELDYFMTRYSNPITGDQNQNNLRFAAGAVLNFW